MQSDPPSGRVNVIEAGLRGRDGKASDVSSQHRRRTEARLFLITVAAASFNGRLISGKATGAVGIRKYILPIPI